MKDENNIESLFKDSFKDFEVDAGPNVWNNIKSSVQSGIASGSSAATAVGSTSSWVSTVIIVVGITGLAIGGYYFFDSKAEESQAQNSIEQTSDQIEDSKKGETPAYKNNLTEDVQSQENLRLSETNNATEEYKKKQIIEKQKVRQISAANNDEVNTQPYNNQQLKEEENNWTNKANNSYDKPNVNSKSVVNEQTKNTAVKNEMEIDNSSIDQEQIDNEESSPTAYSANTMVDQESEEIQIELIKELPNVFTPNYNGINDEMIIDASYFNHSEEIHFALFDTNNDIIYESRGSEIRFDGMVSGSMLEKDSQYYYVVYVSYKGKRENFIPVMLTVK